MPKYIHTWTITEHLDNITEQSLPSHTSNIQILDFHKETNLSKASVRDPEAANHPTNDQKVPKNFE